LFSVPLCDLSVSAGEYRAKTFTTDAERIHGDTERSILGTIRLNLFVDILEPLK
jgi:hypothetical protein